MSKGARRIAHREFSTVEVHDRGGGGERIAGRVRCVVVDLVALAARHNCYEVRAVGGIAGEIKCNASAYRKQSLDDYFIDEDDDEDEDEEDDEE